MFKPSISVIISTFNDRELVEKKLAEIKAQTAFDRAEFIFIEPASPGLEREVLAPFCEKHPNCHFISLAERVGLYRAWNIGWEAASAPVVCVSNMDDAMHPMLLEGVLDEAAKENWDVVSVLIGKQPIDEEWNVWDHSRLSKLPLSVRPGPFFAWKRELIDRIGLFDERFEMMGDKDFWSRALHHHLKIHLIPKVLYLYTKHPEQISRRQEFREKKGSDRDLADSKDYPSVWPPRLQQKIRMIRWMLKVPILRRTFL